MKKPLLTISLLVSNRMETIPRCLDSLRPIMDAISCELILTDTSKNPEIHKLLLKYTDQVYEFEWCNDFAKARNLGLEKANGEWFMFLDDDEWFVEVDEITDFFQSGEYKKYGYANYIVRNFFDEEYIQYEDCWVPRLFCLGDNVKFFSKVHEYFTPVNNVRKDLQVIVHHSGYIYNTLEKREAHFNRNYELLKEMIHEEPQNLRWYLLLVAEYASASKWDELISFCEECLSFAERENTIGINDNIGTFYEGIARGHYLKKRYRESNEICHRALLDKRANELLIAKMHFRLAENFFCLKEYDQVICHIKEYLKLAKTVNTETDRFHDQTSARLIGNPFAEAVLKTAYILLICSYLEKGEIQVLTDYYDELTWNQNVIYSIDNVEKHIIKAMWTYDYHPIFLRMMVDVFGNQKLSENFRKEILLQEIASANEFQKTLYGLEKALQRLIDGPQDGDMVGYHNALGDYVNALCDWNDFVEKQDAVEIESKSMTKYFEAAISINEYLKKEKQNVVEALRCLKEAVEALPEIADGISRFLNCYGVLEQQRAELQKREMDMLRTQVICQAKTMVEMGQVQAAKKIVEQLHMMFPDDIEIEELIQIL